MSTDIAVESIRKRYAGTRSVVSRFSLAVLLFLSIMGFPYTGCGIARLLCSLAFCLILSTIVNSRGVKRVLSQREPTQEEMARLARIEARLESAGIDPGQIKWRIGDLSYPACSVGRNVSIDEQVFHDLPDEGLAAIVAHELGHVHTGLWPFDRFFELLALTSTIAVATPYIIVQAILGRFREALRAVLGLFSRIWQWPQELAADDYAVAHGFGRSLSASIRILTAGQEEEPGGSHPPVGLRLARLG